jgi:hypothetical protein
MIVTFVRDFDAKMHSKESGDSFAALHARFFGLADVSSCCVLITIYTPMWPDCGSFATLYMRWYMDVIAGITGPWM